MTSPLEAFSSVADSSSEKIQATDKNSFFGADGPSFRDVLDAINPLNHIPIVSTLFSQATEHKASTASRLAGGALLGGPVGFFASLAGVVFESATGKSPSDTLVAAFGGGDDSATQFASAQVPPSVDAAPLAFAALAPAASAASVSASKQSVNGDSDGGTAQAVLDLYGGSSVSAHASYKKAQMLPYLRDVNVSRVL